MTAIPTERRPICPITADLATGLAAWTVVASGLTIGANPLWLAVLVLALPLAGFAATGHLAGRGAMTACLVSVFGAALVATSSGAGLWGSIGLIGVLNGVALFGGIVADQSIRPIPAPIANRPGRWITIVVEYEGVSAPVKAERRRRVGALERSA